MTDSSAFERLLILAPIGRDAELMCIHLRRAGLACETSKDIEALCESLENGAGALLFTEEALTPEAMTRLSLILDHQEAWSELPIIILSAVASFDAKPRTFRELGQRTNVTVIDRPVRIQSLISAAQSAIRARKRQYDVRDLMEKLEERVRERDRFLAILGHELRNPLGAILLACQMTDSEDGSLAADHARLIERQSRHLTRIVNDLLDLSRVVSGKIVIKRQVVDLRGIARQSLQTLQDSARSAAVSVELKTSDEAVMIDADPVRIDQIITNVLSNAIKYTPEGGHVVVTVEHDRRDAVVKVKDDGVGIARDRLATIFELFAQAENAIGRSQGGMGIGLALVRNLIELHGGTIAVTSDGEGKGSEFVIHLPLRIPDEMEVCVPPPAPARRTKAPRHIVIVEDNVDVRELLRLKLRRLGHTVEAVGDGISGVNTIVSRKPHMALIDIGLPQLDGYQVASRVRAQLGEEIVLVAVSGFGQPEDKRKALESGFDDHLTKPADVHDIENLLDRFSPEE